MTLITPTELKTNLKLQGIDTDDLDDETLLNLINLKVNELTALTGIPVNPVTRKQIIQKFKGTLFECEWYPVSEINSLKIDNKELTIDTDFILDESLGVIYFNENLNGLLVIEYTHKVSDDFIKNNINSLISDMALYQLKSNDSNLDGVVSSIHEADQSINYDTNNSLGNRIYTRIGSLKSSFTSCRVKWL